MIEIIIGVVVLVILLGIVQVVKSSPYEKGENSYHDGHTLNMNPFGLSEKIKHSEWKQGWEDAKRDNPQDGGYW